MELDTQEEMDFVIEYLNSLGYSETQDNFFFWVGLKLDGNDFRWPVSGDILSRDSELWHSGDPESEDVCVRFSTESPYELRGNKDCEKSSSRSDMKGVCERAIIRTTTTTPSTTTIGPGRGQ